jgi:lipopolysaccharide/colanic/teichoic acid biosynthesis glycosyltransferase
MEAHHFTDGYERLELSGRNERTYEEMVSLDIEYARRRSLHVDLVILMKTVWVVLIRKGVA